MTNITNICDNISANRFLTMKELQTLGWASLISSVVGGFAQPEDQSSITVRFM